MSRNNVKIYKGKVASDANSPDIRRLLLAEMAARATKSMLRLLLRKSAVQGRSTAHQTQVCHQQCRVVIQCHRPPHSTRIVSSFVAARQQANTHAASNCVSCSLLACQVVLTVESMNIVTGSHRRSHYFWNERLLPIIQNKYGELAVDCAEEGNIGLLLQPCIVYIMQRLQVRLCP